MVELLRKDSHGLVVDDWTYCIIINDVIDVKISNPLKDNVNDIDDVIEVMATTNNVMPHLHMPLQSGSDTILASMRRSYRSEKYMGIIDRVRQAIPDAGITTDIIVGFPGETEEDFQILLDFLEEAQLDRVGCFAYSPVEGAQANELPDPVPEKVRVARQRRLMKLQEKISAARLKQKHDIAGFATAT